MIVISQNELNKCVRYKTILFERAQFVSEYRLLARNLAVEFVQKHAANIGQLLANSLFSMYCVALQEFNA
jgi:hypothetical protein